jgi:hypothetical protein
MGRPRTLRPQLRRDSLGRARSSSASSNGIYAEHPRSESSQGHRPSARHRHRLFGMGHGASPHGWNWPLRAPWHHVPNHRYCLLSGRLGSGDAHWLLLAAAPLAFLGVLGTFPLYLGVGWAQSGAQFPTPDNIAEGGVSALLVGVPVGLWFWCDAHPRGPPWLDALRYPSPAILPKVWIAAVLIAGVSYFGVTRWSASWPAPLVVLSAFVLFVGPLALALVVTLRAGRRRDH